MLDGPSVRRILLERIVDPVVMVIGHVLADEPTQVSLIQRDDMVEKLSATAANPALGYSILPRRLNARALRLQTCAFQECNHIGIEFRIVIQNDIPIRSRSRECLAQLL